MVDVTALPVSDEEPPAETVADLDAAPWPRPLYAWYSVGVLLLAYAFAIVDRTAIGLLVDPIKHSLHISDTQIGLLQGLAFAICYTAFGLPLGYLADRGRRKQLLTAGVAVWSAATVCCGLATGFVTLFAARIGVGIGEASVTPGSGSMISDLFPPEQRGRAYGVWMLGGSAGLALSPLFAAAAIWVADLLHAGGVSWAANLAVWQVAFILVGAPGLLIALLMALTVREPKRRGPAVAADGFPLRPIWRALRARPAAYFALGGGAVLNVTCIYAQIGWMPALFMRVFHWGPIQIGPAFSAVSLLFGMSGALVAGWTMTWLARRGRRDGPILISVAHSLATLVFGVAACLSPRPEITLGLNGLAAITSTWSYAAAMTGLNQITPNQLRGQIMAIYTLGTGLISMTAGTLFVGLLADNVFRAPGGVAPSLASVYAACSIVALIVLLAGRRAYATAERASVSSQPARKPA